MKKENKKRSKKTLALTVVILGVFVFSGCFSGGRNDGGVYKSIDAGSSFEQKGIIDEKTNLFSQDTIALAIDPGNSSVIFAGTEKNGLFKSIDAGETWTQNPNELFSVSDIIINPQNSDEMYITSDLEGKGRILKTTNGGKDWLEPFTQSTGAAQNWRLAMDPKNPTVLYAGDSRGGIYKTEDSGETWKTLIWAKSGIRRISIDKVDTSRVYFGTTGSGAIRTDNAGKDFVEITPSGMTYEITAHPYKAGVVYLVNQEGLFRSNDSGGSLEKIDTLVQPEELKARVVEIDPKNDNVMYLVTGSAFHKSVNAGKTWSPVDLNISRLVGSLVIDSNETNIIYLGAAEKAGGGLYPVTF